MMGVSTRWDHRPRCVDTNADTSAAGAHCPLIGSCRSQRRTAPLMRRTGRREVPTLLGQFRGRQVRPCPIRGAVLLDPLPVAWCELARVGTHEEVRTEVIALLKLAPAVSTEEWTGPDDGVQHFLAVRGLSKSSGFVHTTDPPVLPCEHCVHCRGGLALHGRRDVRVRVQGDRDRRVAQHLGHDLRVTPRPSSSLAAVWRRSWNRIRGAAARTHSALNAPRTNDACSGRPACVANTTSSSIHSDPAARRSTICAAR